LKRSAVDIERLLDDPKLRQVFEVVLTRIYHGDSVARHRRLFETTVRVLGGDAVGIVET